jgi:hypothetical protein
MFIIVNYDLGGDKSYKEFINQGILDQAKFTVSQGKFTVKRPIKSNEIYQNE